MHRTSIVSSSAPFSTVSSLALVLAAAVALAACGDDPADAPDSGIDTGADAADTAADVAEIEAAPTGTSAMMRTDANLGSPDEFYDYPYPADVRLEADGTLDLSGFPNTGSNDLATGLIGAAGQNYGFPIITAGYVRFDAELAERDSEAVIMPSTDAPMLLLNVDADSAEYGRAYPLVSFALEADNYAGENILAMAPRPGFVLDPNTQYAYVVRRNLNDAAGAELGVDETLWRVAHGATETDAEAELSSRLATLWPALDTFGVDPETVAAATVFTTGDVHAHTYEISENVRDTYDPQITNIRVDPDDGAHERFCEVLGEIELPQFQAGTPPFASEGMFQFDENGHVIEQRMETIPVVFTFPTEEMPVGGYPLVMYFHGSGGYTSQVIDRGTQPSEDEPAIVGEGPAFVLAAHGFGAAGSAHPVNPERVEGASDIEYIPFANLRAMRDTFRQGIIEQRLYIDALESLRVSPEVVEACGLTLPEGEDTFRYNTDRLLAMGQSMGGMLTNLIGAVEPRITAVVPTGAGGFWSYFILETELIPNIDVLVGGLFGTRAELTFMHPLFHIAQTAYEPIEPIAAVTRLARNPLPGHPVRPIYEPVAPGDSYFPTVIYDAFALAYNNEQAGDEYWENMQSVLALDERDGFTEYPVVNNRTSLTGEDYTGVVVQYGDVGFWDPHVIFVQMDEVKYQYGCFFESFYNTGIATVPAPAALGTPCPQ